MVAAGTIPRSNRFHSRSGRSRTSSPSSPQHIEQVDRLTASPTAKEVRRTAVGARMEDDNLAIEHGLAIEVQVNRTGEIGEGLEDIPTPRDRPRLMRTHVRWRPKSVHLLLENIDVVVERIGAKPAS